MKFRIMTEIHENGAVSKCELQANSPLQKLDKAVKIQFLSDFHGFIVGLIFRKFYFKTAPGVSKKPRRVCRPQAAKRLRIIFCRGVYLTENTYQAASVRFVRCKRTKRARSRLQSLCQKRAKPFFDNLSQGLLSAGGKKNANPFWGISFYLFIPTLLRALVRRGTPMTVSMISGSIKVPL